MSARRYPERPLVGVGVVVWDGDDLLLVRRGRPPRDGEWGLPGGAQKVGETLFEAAAREVLEETGLKVAPREVITAVDSLHYDDSGRVEYHYTLIEVEAEYRRGEATAGGDVTAVRWVRADEVDALGLWDELGRVVKLSQSRRLERREKTPGPSRLTLRPPLTRVMQSPLGRLIARPWLDQVSLRLLGDWYLPMSRAWAAATVSDGDFDRFCELVGVSPKKVADRAVIEVQLDIVKRAAARAARASESWEEAWFEDPHAPLPRCVSTEEERLDAEQAQTFSRLGFAIFSRAHRLSACDWAIADHETVEQRHAARLETPEAAYPAPAPPARIEESRHVPSDFGEGPEGREFMLRYHHDLAPDGVPAWARVFDPNPHQPGPTVLMLHGLAMEMDMMRAPRDEINRLCRLGIRVIAMEGPWHGRRRLRGTYGGEVVVARSPLGPLDYFRAHVAEIAHMTRWARQSGATAVGWMGTSMGAFTCQLAASYGRYWPRSLWADALFLITPSQGFHDIAVHGAFAKAFAVEPALSAAGWTDADLERFGKLCDPLGHTVVPPESVFMLIGEHDSVAPARGALRMAEDWAVPQSNRYLRAQGHFSVPAGLMVDDAPLESFARKLLKGSS